MHIKWYGQASFRITTISGTTIITDPYTPEELGYKPFEESADIVIISSDNDSGHCRADLIPGEAIVVDALKLALGEGATTVQGMPISAIQTMEWLDRTDRDPDLNGMYRFVVDGMHIGHMGDVGNALTAEQIAFFAGVDIMLALTGGPPTIGLDALEAALGEIRPKIVIPMHFQTLSYKPRNILWLPSFIDRYPYEMTEFVCSAETTINPEDFTDQMKILVLDYV